MTKKGRPRKTAFNVTREGRIWEAIHRDVIKCDFSATAAEVAMIAGLGASTVKESRTWKWTRRLKVALANLPPQPKATNPRIRYNSNLIASR